jgi:hypothetical protein
MELEGLAGQLVGEALLPSLWWETKLVQPILLVFIPYYAVSDSGKFYLLVMSVEIALLVV